MTPLQELIEELPPELQQEVEDFARFLLETKARSTAYQPHVKPTFSWAGALKDLRDQYTSVELQHEISSSRMNST